MSYSVDTANLFAVLDGGSAKVEATKPTGDDAASNGGAAHRDSGRRQNGNRGRGSSGRGRGRGRGGGSSGDFGGDRDGGGDSRRGGRGRRDNRRGGAGGRGAKRLYDRHSGTRQGTTTEKRDGAGAGNWGRAGDEEVADVTDRNVDVIDGDDEDREDSGIATVGLDEFEKQRAEKAAKLALPAPRKAGEGEDDSRWGNMAKLDREDAADSMPSSNKKTGGKNKKNAKHVPLNKVFHVQESKNKRGDRGGRGRGAGRGANSGGRGRGNDRGESSRKNMSLDDQTSFPALGAK